MGAMFVRADSTRRPYARVHRIEQLNALGGINLAEMESGGCGMESGGGGLWRWSQEVAPPWAGASRPCSRREE